MKTNPWVNVFVVQFIGNKETTNIATVHLYLHNFQYSTESEQNASF